MKKKYIIEEEIQIDDTILEVGDSFSLIEGSIDGEVVKLNEGFAPKTDAEKKADVEDAIKTIVDTKWGNLADRKVAITALNRILNSSDAKAKMLIKYLDKITTETDSALYKD